MWGVRGGVGAPPPLQRYGLREGGCPPRTPSLDTFWPPNVKDKSSALRKAMTVFDEHKAGEAKGGTFESPACRYITDMLRLSVSAADPYYIYLSYLTIRSEERREI